MDLRIILMGKTGSGKSSLGNSLLNENASKVGRGMVPKTAQCQWKCKNGGTVFQVVDTPGVYDMHTSVEETCNEMIKCLAFANPGPHVNLWFLRSDHRMTEVVDTVEETCNKMIKCLALANPGPDVFLWLLRSDHRMTEEELTETPEQLSNWIISSDGIDAPRDTLRERKKKAAYFNTPDNRNKRQDDCDQDRAAKDDRTEKRNLVAIVTGFVTRSSTGLQTGRTDVFVGNGNLLNESFRQQHNIRNIVTVKVIPLNADLAVDPTTKVRVRMRPTGEGKDSWEHCINQDGNVALPEAQFLCISQLLCGRSSFPASATWFLETPKKCPPSSTLEAVVDIDLVTADAIKRRDASSSAVNLVLPVEIKEKEVPNIYSDPELSSLWLNTDIDGDDRALEEKSQTEAMEK